MNTEIILLIMLVALSFFFSMSETALISVSRLRLKHLIEKKRKGAIELKKLKDDTHRLLVTILIGNNLVNTTASAIATDMAIKILRNNALGIAVGIMTFILLIFGDLIPKTIGARRSISIALKVAKPIWILSNLFYPIIRAYDLIIETVFKRIGLKKSEKPFVTEEEIRSIISLGEEEGAIKLTEKEMIESIFKFDNTEIRQVMIPKAEIISISSEATIKDFLDILNRYGYSRYPVYEKSKDNIIGVIFYKDATKEIYEGKLETPVKKIMRRPRFVFETKKIDTLMRQFQKLNEHIAIVISESGKVVGIVTLEDVLEELVGEISDEAEKIRIKKVLPQPTKQ